MCYHNKRVFDKFIRAKYLKFLNNTLRYAENCLQIPLRLFRIAEKYH